MNDFEEILEQIYTENKETIMLGDFNLWRYAANDKIFKLFFLHPFLASTIYNNIIKNKFDIG